jgi:hypothetical protein
MGAETEEEEEKPTEEEEEEEQQQRSLLKHPFAKNIKTGQNPANIN